MYSTIQYKIWYGPLNRMLFGMKQGMDSTDTAHMLVREFVDTTHMLVIGSVDTAYMLVIGSVDIANMHFC